MTFNKLNIVFLSATGTTKKIVEEIANSINIENKNFINLLYQDQKEIIFPETELTVFAAPVFSGRIPEFAVERFQNIKGNNSKAIIICVYGNRDFDDALIELKNITTSNGFEVISAAAFIAQHSIFPKVAENRPDESDMEKVKDFAIKSFETSINKNIESKLENLKGNFPYRETKKIPLKPKKNKECNKCGLCAKQCPTNAIDFNNLGKIDKNKCISCSHCIYICPKNAKKYSGLLYWLVSKKFNKSCSERKEPYTIYAK